MREFHIMIRSFQQVRDFVALAMVQPFEVLVGNERQKVNGKSFIGMFTLDYQFPVRVSVDCSQEEYERFRSKALSLTSGSPATF